MKKRLQHIRCPQIGDVIEHRQSGKRLVYMGLRIERVVVNGNTLHKMWRMVGDRFADCEVNNPTFQTSYTMTGRAVSLNWPPIGV